MFVTVFRRNRMNDCTHNKLLQEKRRFMVGQHNTCVIAIDTKRNNKHLCGDSSLCLPI